MLLGLLVDAAAEVAAGAAARAAARAAAGADAGADAHTEKSQTTTPRSITPRSQILPLGPNPLLIKPYTTALYRNREYELHDRILIWVQIEQFGNQVF